MRRDQAPARLGKRGAVLDLARGDVCGEFELKPAAPRHVEIFEEACALVVLVELAINEIVALVAIPPLGDGRVACAGLLLPRPGGKMHERPEPMPLDPARRNAALALADALADRDVEIVLTDPHAPLRRPKLNHPWVDVVEDFAREAVTVRRRDAV